jgi:TfoX/Sxy family transcriptional regulator of competence genes
MEMAYDEALAERVRAALASEPAITEQKMFGGIGFMLRGNLCCGVLKDRLLVRVGPEGHDTAVAQPGVEPMVMGGRSSRGFVVVDQNVLDTESTLAEWVRRGLEFAGSLPPK